MHKEFIDLGCGLDSNPVAVSETPKKHYPCFSFTCDEEIDLPDGEFTFTAKGRCVDTGANKRDPEDPRYRYEIEVQGFKPMGGAKKESADMGDAFKKSLTAGMAKRMGKGEEEDES